MSDSDSDVSLDEADIPSAAVCQERIDKFVSVTGTDEALAQMRLQKAKWNLEVAIEKHFGKEVRGLDVSKNEAFVPEQY